MPRTSAQTDEANLLNSCLVLSESYRHTLLRRHQPP